MRPAAVFVALWLAALIGFAVLAGFAAAYDTFPADIWLAHRIQEIDSAVFARAVDWAEDLADAPLMIAVWLAAVAGLLAVARRGEALLLLIIMSACLANSGLKELVERPRPSPELVQVSHDSGTFSFPSGHAEGAMVLYGLLAYFAGLLIPYRPLRLLVQAACLWVIAFTSLERVYVGAHWPSDAAGGLYFGGLALAALIAAQRSLSRRPG